MPYIETEQRKKLSPWGEYVPENPGELNYLITLICNQYWIRRKNYQAIAEITGVLENVKQEFYRRIATPYEDNKIAINGDVY